MTVVNSIRTIAKTDILEEKIGKALAQSDAANTQIKPNFLAERAVAIDTGASTNVSSGSPANPDGQTVVTGSGSTQAPPSNGYLYGQDTDGDPNEAILDGATNAGSTNSDIQTENEIAANLNKINSGFSTNLTNNAKGGGTPGINGGTGGGVIGGTNAANVASNGATNPTVQAIGASTLAAGGTQEEADAAMTAATDAIYGSPGVASAKSIADNTTGSIQTTPASSFGNPIKIDQGTEDPALVAIAGWNAKGIISDQTASLLNQIVYLKNTYPTPTPADSSAQRQNTWSSPSVPPLKLSYNQGRVWVLQSGLTLINAQTFDGLVVEREAVDDTKAYTIVGGFVASLTPNPGDALIQFGQKNAEVGDSAGDVGGTQYIFSDYIPATTVAAGHYGQEDCGLESATNATCALPSPFETAWPKTGTAVLALVDGLFAGNPYDSEVPFEFKAPTSEVRLAVGDGVNVIDDRFVDIKLGVAGGYLVNTVKADGETIESSRYYNAQGVLQAAPPTQDIQYYETD